MWTGNALLFDARKLKPSASKFLQPAVVKAMPVTLGMTSIIKLCPPVKMCQRSALLISLKCLSGNYIIVCESARDFQSSRLVTLGSFTLSCVPRMLFGILSAIFNYP